MNLKKWDNEGRVSGKDQHVSLINNISTYNTYLFYQHALDSGQEMRQDLNEDTSHPLAIGVHVFLLQLLLITIFIKFFCISSHWCAKNGKTNPVAHSSSLAFFFWCHCASGRCNSPRERHNPSCSSRSNIPPVPLLPPGPPGQLAVMPTVSTAMGQRGDTSGRKWLGGWSQQRGDRKE